jgi:hypothetical protein
MTNTLAVVRHEIPWTAGFPDQHHPGHPTYLCPHTL